jgi:hypothetical protein
MPIQTYSFKNINSWRRDITCCLDFVFPGGERDGGGCEVEFLAGEDGGYFEVDFLEGYGAGEEICEMEFYGEAVLVFSVGCSGTDLEDKVVSEAAFSGYNS